MSEQAWVALIAAGPPTLAAVLGYVASKRSLKRSIGGNPGVPLREMLRQMQSRTDRRFDSLEIKIDRAVEQSALMRERLARLEADDRPWGRSH